MAHEDIKSVLLEERSFPPPAEFAALAHISRAGADALYEKAAADHLGFWGELARRKELQWQTPFTETLDDSKRPELSDGSPTGG